MQQKKCDQKLVMASQMQLKSTIQRYNELSDIDEIARVNATQNNILHQ